MGQVHRTLLTPYQMKEVVTPPTNGQICDIIRSKPAFKSTVLKAASAMGINTAKVLSPSNPEARTVPRASAGPAYQPSPCDFGAGVWITFAHPLAAQGWPPTSWALLSASGACFLLYPTTGQYPPMDILKGYLDGGPQITTLLPSDDSVLYVQFRPDRPGLYAVTLNAGDAATAAHFQAPSGKGSIAAYGAPIDFATGGQADLLSGTSVAGNKVLAIVQVTQKQLAPGHFVFMMFSDPADGWSFGGIKISRLSD